MTVQQTNVSPNPQLKMCLYPSVNVQIEIRKTVILATSALL